MLGNPSQVNPMHSVIETVAFEVAPGGSSRIESSEDTDCIMIITTIAIYYRYLSPRCYYYYYVLKVYHRCIGHISATTTIYYSHYLYLLLPSTIIA